MKAIIKEASDGQFGSSNVLEDLKKEGANELNRVYEDLKQSAIMSPNIRISGRDSGASTS